MCVAERGDAWFGRRRPRPPLTVWPGVRPRLAEVYRVAIDCFDCPHGGIDRHMSHICEHCLKSGAVDQVDADKDCSLKARSGLLLNERS
jgi:hypothetical protein